jgi:hypothetical protein
MLSSVLRSPQAVRVNVEIMRAFVRLRTALAVDRTLVRRLVAGSLASGFQLPGDSLHPSPKAIQEPT